MDSGLIEHLLEVAVFFVPFLFSLCVHEFAHGLVAKWRGDNTAQALGRLTLNPNAHADLMGTYILPIASLLMKSPILLGWGQPVPVNARNLKNPRVDMFWIALAGPVSNILMAFIGAFLFVGLQRLGLMLGQRSMGEGVFIQFIALNLSLAFFNLIPVHPLDGGKVLARFIPIQWDRKLEENQRMLSLILMVMAMTGGLSFIRYPVIFGLNSFVLLAERVL